MGKVITQGDIHRKTGIPSENISLALAQVTPSYRASAYNYDFEKAKKALIQFCTRRQQYYASKVKIWTDRIEACEAMESDQEAINHG